ncbi:MAG TPA: hypothetical protein VK638_39350 [Edaphobacter sp.]|nr:hypothetical protein [Edaphobacter sp.]
MAVRLESFQYLPRGTNGWGSGLLHFGNLFTTVQGKNGTGKTPIMKGVMQGLGHELELPPEIRERCEFAETTLLVDGRTVMIRRKIATEFDIRVSDGQEVQYFTSPVEYAKWFTGLFSEDPPVLTTKQNQSTELYANVLLPAIWVDQDHGWTSDYWTPTNRNFVLDQREEVIRFLVGLPPRHSFRARTEFDAAKQALDRTERAIEMQRFIVDRLQRNEQLAEQEEPGLVARRLQLQQELDANSEVLEAIRSTTVSFDREILAIETQRDALLARQGALVQRKTQLSLVLSELDGEEDILTANVQATDLLRQFCSREDCQMFATSERSFGRSLLFLKDQIKDLKSSDREASRDVDSVTQEIAAAEANLVTKRTERRNAVDASPQASVMGRLGALTKELVEVELRLAKLQQYVVEQRKFERLLDRREHEAVAVANTRPTGVRGATGVGDVRQLLSDAMQQWLVTLGTQNTKEARFDDDFVLYVDGAKFAATTHQSGSTRTRIVLAFHAALMEVSLARGGNHPGWLLFDAPKQHELNQSDFDAYTDRLKMVATKYAGRVQVVFSAADLKTQFESGDEVWIPVFTMDGVPRFLGDTTSTSI